MAYSPAAQISVGPIALGIAALQDLLKVEIILTQQPSMSDPAGSGIVMGFRTSTGKAFALKFTDGNVEQIPAQF